ncbi:MAG: hypothetical protein FJ276_15110 [Planctomycetes bacterium]|nr:hypothetical protein [Planctomycetota bacterium]
MSIVTEEPRLHVDQTKADSLATSLLFLLALTVAQRFIGFLRNILFCGFMQDDELGRWSLAFSFLVLASPLVVLGLPGSFGRYVERYRQRGQLRSFLAYTTAASLLCVAVASAAIMATARTWAWLVFGDATLAPLVTLLTVTLVAVTASNFVTELLTALRRVRAVSVMQFVGSVTFAVLAVTLLAVTPLREEAVIIAFGVSSLIAALGMIGPLRWVRREATASGSLMPRGQLWRKLLPFAAWVWVINLTANLFDAADRFMIVHFAKETGATAESLVGQYHASYVVPYLLVGVAGTVAAAILPYLSHDWEAGDYAGVSRRLRLSFKLGSLGMTGVGAAILVGSPILFTWILRGRYDQGLSVLPWTLTYCAWFSLTIIAQNYLWCAEKARLGSLALAIGLATNIGLNFVLLPRFGLLGAVLATAMANAVALTMVLYFSRRLGLAADRGMLACAALPLALATGPYPAAAILLSVAALASRGSWLFDEGEKRELAAVAGRYWSRVRALVTSRRMAST